MRIIYIHWKVTQAWKLLGNIVIFCTTVPTKLAFYYSGPLKEDTPRKGHCIKYLSTMDKTKYPIFILPINIKRLQFLKEDNLYTVDKPLEFILVPKCPLYLDPSPFQRQCVVGILRSHLSGTLPALLNGCSFYPPYSILLLTLLGVLQSRSSSYYFQLKKI